MGKGRERVNIDGERPQGARLCEQASRGLNEKGTEAYSESWIQKVADVSALKT